jgi:hypothetical protein
MPIHEFKCIKGHVTEKLFLTFGEAEQVDEIVCPVCTPRITRVNENYPKAKKMISAPGYAILYGDGFYKPAASGKQATRGADPSKVAKEVVQEMGGAKLAQAVKGAK